MDSIAAFEQAKMRAFINYGIFNNAQYGSLTSIVIGNEQENSYDATSIETILYNSHIKGNFIIADSIQLERKIFTIYNECCVLLKNFSSKNENTSVFKYSLVRRTGFQKENNIFPVFIDELEIVAQLNDSLNITYLINRNKNRYEIKSHYENKNNSKEIKFKNTYRDYSTVSEFDSEKSTTYYSSLSSGLWAAYLFELFDQISFNSILNKNKANQLITLEQGNIDKNNLLNSVNSFILSSKKLKTEALKISIEDININTNHLKIKLKQDGNPTPMEAYPGSDIPQNIRMKRLDRKLQKKLIKENWSAFGYSDVKTAHFKLKSFEVRDEFISGSAVLETQNLGNGILKGMQISRTEIENQLKSKINSLNQIELEDNSDLSVQTSKTLIGEQTKRIEPYFIFFRKINKSYYQLKVILFYKI